MTENIYTDDINEETFDGLLKNAIESDTPTEHTVPLNDECVFSNGVYFEDFITKASVNVTVLEHYPLDEHVAIDKWFIELHCDDAVFTKEVSTGEEASLVFDTTPPAVAEGIDPIVAPGAGMFTLNIVGYGEEHANTLIKIKVS